MSKKINVLLVKEYKEEEKIQNTIFRSCLETYDERA